MSVVSYLIVIGICLAASAFFSGSETALLRLRSHDIDEEVEEGGGPAAVAARDLVSSNTSRLLVTILLGNNVVNILGASAAAAVSVHYLGVDLGITVSTIVMTVLVLAFCEVFPKAVAASHPRGVSRVVALPLYIFHQLLRPVHALFDRVIEPVVRRLTGGVADEPLSSEEVLRLAKHVRDGQEEGSPLAIIGATSEAADMTVAEIMVPRTEISAFRHDAAPAELLEFMLEERYTRVPIYEEEIDHVLGVVHLKDLIKLVRKEGRDVIGILKPILRVPERKLILRLLTDMQRAFCHMALVKDEFGVTLGLVTQEDILEEIVGEIRDEFDREELLTIRRLPDGSFEALGRISVLDLNRESGWSVPAERGDTVGGLVFNTLGRAPHKGEVVQVPGYVLTCVDVSGSRITRVRVAEGPESTSSEDESTQNAPTSRRHGNGNGHGARR